MYCLQDETCDVKNCNTCKKGDSKICYICDAHYKVTPFGTCTPLACRDICCKRCREYDICVECKLGYYVDGGKCNFKCNPDSCKRCSYSVTKGQKCYECNKGYKLEAGDYCLKDSVKQLRTLE